jgi:hypothetical protein
VVGWLAIAAILLSCAVIFGAHLELKGFDLAAAEPPSSSADAPLHASLQGFATGFATGFSQ